MSLTPLVASAMIGLSTTTTPSTSIPTPRDLIVGAFVQDDADSKESEESKSPWSGNLGGGLAYTKTTTTTVAINFNASANRVDDMSRWTNSAKVVYNKNDGEVQDNFLIVQSEFDRLFREGGNLNWFVQSSWQHNETEIYTDRFKGFGGLGYFLYRQDDITWNVKGGAGATWDRRGTMAGWAARSLVGSNCTWTITEGMTFTGSASIENEFGRLERYLAVLELRVDVALKMLDNLSVFASLRDEYDSAPGEGDSWNQLWITLGVSYGF